MSQLPVPAVAPYVPGPDPAVRRVDVAAIAPLFRFMRDAEQRFGSLRMTILDRHVGARGDTVARTDVWLRHPGSSRVVLGDSDAPARGGYQAWVIAGDTVTHYEADANVIRSRPRLSVPDGADTNTDLPNFGRVYRPRTALPAGSLADAFVHPHGFCRNVLATGALSTAGIATSSGGREMTLVRCDHPRSAKILVDRPDRWILVGADRETGLILLLEEHVGDDLTRRAEVTSLSLDEPLGDEVFTMHVSADVRRLY
jgi:hypothetical protein